MASSIESSLLKDITRGFKRALVDPVLLRFGYEIWAVQPEWWSRPLSDRETQKLLNLAAEVIWSAIGAKFGVDRSRVQREAENFFDILPSCPVIQNHGGNGFNGGLLLYVIAVILNPEVIIESGVFRGFTTWVMRRACPKAKIFCFDLTFRALRYRDSVATYIERDWSEFKFGAGELKNSLCFFDDHVDQWQRIEEVKHLDGRTVVFDDSVLPYKIHTEPNLAVPSAAFLLEKSLLDGKKIEWCHGSLKLCYSPDVRRALEIVAFCRDIVQLPSLTDQTGYRPAFLTLVEL
jgi:hypothetical protein